MDKYTIDQAFDYFYGSEDECNLLNSERGVRAVAYLLTYCSEMGNEPLDGDAAVGLARILNYCASDLARLEIRRQWLARNGGRQ